MPSRVSARAAGSSGSPDVASFTDPTGWVVNAGNIIAVAVWAHTTTAPSSITIQDSDDNDPTKWTIFEGPITQTTTTAIVAWRKVAGSGSHTIYIKVSANISATLNFAGVEMSSADPNNPIDVSAYTKGTSVSGTPTGLFSTPAATYANDFVAAFAGWVNSAAVISAISLTGSPSNPTSITNETVGTSSGSHNMGCQVIDGTGGAAGSTYSFQETIAANVAYIQFLVAFNPVIVVPTSTQPAPALGFGLRGPGPVGSTLQALEHFSIIECHWNVVQPNTNDGTDTIDATWLQSVSNTVQKVRTWNNANVRGCVWIGQSSITDAATTNGSTTLSSPAQAKFTQADVGSYVLLPNVPYGTTIASVTNSTTAVMSAKATATASGQPLQIGIPQTLRLRVETGRYAPSGILALSGGSVQLTRAGQSTPTIYVPRWWTSAVQTAYQNFINKLSAALVSGDGGSTYTSIDACPEINEVHAALTMEWFGEQFIRFPGDTNPDGQTNAQHLLAAGLTNANDYAAMQFANTVHVNAFLHTIVMLDCNGYQDVQTTGLPAGALTGLNFTQGIIEDLKGKALGFELTNASLDVSGNSRLYSLMANYGPTGLGVCAISFQMMPTVSDCNTVAQRALGYGASSIEVCQSTGSPAHNPTAADLVADPQLIANFPTTPNYPWQSGTATAPSAPIIGTATATGTSGQVTLTWTPGGSGGSAITSFTITPYLNGTTAQAPITGISPSATSYTVTGLTNGSSYTFTVKAINAIGTSAESSQSNSATPNSGTSAPAAPLAPTLTAGDGQLTVTWSPPDPGSSAITSYTVEILQGSTVVQTLTASPTPNPSVIANNLQNGTSYTAKVAATSSVGTGPFSPQSSAVAPQATGSSPAAFIGNVTPVWVAPST